MGLLYDRMRKRREETEAMGGGAPQQMSAPPTAPTSLYERLKQQRGIASGQAPLGAPQEDDSGSLWGFGENLVTDAGEIIGGLYQAVRHPIETGQAIAENPGALLDPYKEQLSDPLGYGYKKPISSLLNVSVGSGLLGLGAKAGKAGLVAKAGQTTKASEALGKVSDVASKVSRYTDPVAFAGRGIARGSKAAANLATEGLGASTTAGAESVRTAGRAGFESGFLGYGQGEQAKAFRRQQTAKNADPFEPFEHAKSAVKSMKENVGAAHSAAMQPIYADPTPRSFATIDAAIASARSGFMHTPPGGGVPVPKQPEALKVVDEMEQIVNEWKARPPEYHTIGAFHDMKRQLWEKAGGYERGTPQSAAAAKVYHSVKDSITNVAPEYAVIMKNFDDAVFKIDEIAKELSLTDTAQRATGVRKLQSALRDTTPNTAGIRKMLVDAIGGNAKADTLISELAGQNLRLKIRPGIAAQAGLLGVGGALTGAINPSFIITLGAFSPRAVGSGAYRAGQAAQIVKPMLIIERAMRNKFNISGKQVGKGAGLIAAASGRLVQAQEQADSFKIAMMQQAKKLNYNIHPRVIESAVDKLLSDDPLLYRRGIDIVGANKRLMEIFEAMGTKGEQ